MSIAARLRVINGRVATACIAAGRRPDSVRLLAASKTRTASDVVEAMVAGQVLFGENRGQEMRDKPGAVELLAAPSTGLPAPEWHFIGALQRNKVKYVVGRASLVHAVDSLRLGQALSDRVQRIGVAPIGVLVEVNVGAEQSKAGTTPDEALPLAAALQELPGVAVRGLMTIPPAVGDPAEAAPYFARMQTLLAEGRAAGLPLEELSMGMSSDFEVAISHGATIVRVGTAIFGPRR